MLLNTVNFIQGMDVSFHPPSPPLLFPPPDLALRLQGAGGHGRDIKSWRPGQVSQVTATPVREGSQRPCRCPDDRLPPGPLLSPAHQPLQKLPGLSPSHLLCT